jgi:hypothetical protein
VAPLGPHVGSPSGASTTGPDATLNTSQGPASPLSEMVAGAHGTGPAPTVLLASQPAGAPPPGAAPSPGGPPTPGSPQPTTPSPSPSQPAQPPGSPPTPGVPAPGAPTPGTPPQPGTPSQPGTPTQVVRDAGISDAISLPPVPDGGVPADSGMQPILRRDAR